MTINIPPSVFGSAELYSLPEAYTLAPNPSADLDFTNTLAYGPIFGVPRSAFIDLIIHSTANSNVGGNSLIFDSIDASFDGGTTYMNVILPQTCYIAALGYRHWERFYGFNNVLPLLNLAAGGIVKLRMVNFGRSVADAAIENAYFALRVINIGLPAGP